MLGLPNWAEPEFINTFAGAWLKTLVAIERTMVISSATVPREGKSSEMEAPLWPYFLNFLGVARSLGVSLEKESMKAKRLPLMNS